MMNNNTSHPISGIQTEVQNHTQECNDAWYTRAASCTCSTRKGEPSAVKAGAVDVAMERFTRIGFGMSEFLDAYEADKRTVIKDQTCKRCCRVLYWEDIGKDYRAVCCGQVYFEHKGR